MEKSTNRIKRHLKYLWYLIRHKWYVAYYGYKLGVSWWRLLKHDLSKFYPDEWYPYSYYYFGAHKDEQDLLIARQEFKAAWNIHFSRNDHHFEWWQGKKMSEQATREMVADWIGAGFAKNKRDILEWYSKWEHKDKVHPETIIRVEELLGQYIIISGGKLNGV